MGHLLFSSLRGSNQQGIDCRYSAPMSTGSKSPSPAKSLTSDSPQQEHRDSSEMRKRGSKSRPRQQHPLDPVQTREFRKWKKRADKYIARGQKEMFEMLEESFSKFFPSRRTMEKMQMDAALNADGESDPGKTAPRSPKRRKVLNPQHSEGTTSQRQEQTCSTGPSAAVPTSAGSSEQKDLAKNKMDSNQGGGVPQEREARSPKALQRSSDTPLPSNPKLADIMATDDPEALLEGLAPGITKNLKGVEILHLLHICEKLPQWRALGLDQRRKKLETSPMPQKPKQDSELCTTGICARRRQPTEGTPTKVLSEPKVSEQVSGTGKLPTDTSRTQETSKSSPPVSLKHQI